MSAITGVGHTPGSHPMGTLYLYPSLQDGLMYSLMYISGKHISHLNTSPDWAAASPQLVPDPQHKVPRSGMGDVRTTPDRMIGCCSSHAKPLDRPGVGHAPGSSQMSKHLQQNDRIFRQPSGYVKGRGWVPRRRRAVGGVIPPRESALNILHQLQRTT
jgi:hypothetical protein